MYKLSVTTLNALKPFSDFSSRDPLKTSLGLLSLIIDNPDLFPPPIDRAEQLTFFARTRDHKGIVKKLLGELPGEPFNCGVWSVAPGSFRALCPHARAEATATLLILAFEIGICSPLDTQYPGYVQAQQGLIKFFSDISQTHGVLAQQVWARMNAASPFLDPTDWLRTACTYEAFELRDGA